MEETELLNPRNSNTLDIAENKKSSDTKNHLIERIIEEIGYGKYTFLLYLMISIISVIDGSEALITALVNYILSKVVWLRSSEDMSMYSTLVYTGLFIGTLLSVTIADRLGRRKPIIIFLSLALGIGIISSLSPSFTFLIITRTLYTMSFGVLIPLGVTYVMETTSKAVRGKVNIFLTSGGYAAGEIYTIIFAYAVGAEKEGTSSWRVLMWWILVPILIALVISIMYLKESPRFVILKNPIQAVEIFREMFKMNHQSELVVDSSEIAEIQELSIAHQKKMNVNPFFELFRGENRRITTCLWVLWYIILFMFTGIPFMMPLISGSEEGFLDYRTLIYSVATEIPGHIISYSLIENPCFGRKKILYVSLFACAIFSFSAYLFESYFLLFSCLVRLGACISYDIISPYTSELYHTNCRVSGTGCGVALGRVGSLMVPWLIVGVLNITDVKAYVVFGCLSVVGFIASILIPYDTTGKELDKEK